MHQIPQGLRGIYQGMERRKEKNRKNVGKKMKGSVEKMEKARKEMRKMIKVEIKKGRGQCDWRRRRRDESGG